MTGGAEALAQRPENQALFGDIEQQPEALVRVDAQVANEACDVVGREAVFPVQAAAFPGMGSQAAGVQVEQPEAHDLTLEITSYSGENSASMIQPSSTPRIRVSSGSSMACIRPTDSRTSRS